MNDEEAKFIYKNAKKFNEMCQNEIKTFRKRQDVLVELLRQVFVNKEFYSFAMAELRLCLERGKYLNFRVRYEFLEKENTYRSIGNAIKVLQEIGYSIKHEKRKYVYLSPKNERFYIITQAIQEKKKIMFDYKNKDFGDFEAVNKISSKLSKFKEKHSAESFTLEKNFSFINDELYIHDIVISPYDIISPYLIGGYSEKSSKIPNKTFDIYAFELEKIHNIRLLKKLRTRPYYRLEKAIKKLPEFFNISNQKDIKESYDEEYFNLSKTKTQQILDKRIPFYMNYEISNYYEDISESLKEKFIGVKKLNKENSSKYRVKFIHYDENDAFQFIRGKNNDSLDIKFKDKEIQEKYIEWLTYHN